MADRYIVQKGDTLSTIAQKLTGTWKNYNTIAAVNGIQDVDKIQEGQELLIPTKYNEPLRFEDIPTKNKKIIIDNFSPNFNYIIEGDKIYYSKKGNDHWVDISDNDKARKNLFDFIGNKYDFRGYEDGEKEIWNRVNQNNFDYPTYRDSVNNSITNTIKVFEENVSKALGNMSNSKNLKFKITPNSGISKTALLPDESTVSYNISLPQFAEFDPEKIRQVENNILNIPDHKTVEAIPEKEIIDWQVIKNGFRRFYDKYFNKDQIVELNIPTEHAESQYAIRPGVQVSDTLRRKSDFADRYFLSEFIPAETYTYSGRNRGDYVPRDTEGAPITLLNPLYPYDSKVIPTATYVGYDVNGNLKVGLGKDFTEGDMLSKTVRNNIISLKTDNSGNVVGKTKSKNRTFMYPVTTYYDDFGNVKTDESNPNRSALNIIFKDPNAYGSAQGGRVIIQTGNEVAIVSGSLNTINRKFEEMKRRNGVDSGYFYTLDNGTFATGLRTGNKKFTERDLRLYDRENTGGGNLMYITGTQSDKFPSDTVWTPHIRTTESDSYKKGHGLINELKGITLHHTGYIGGLAGVTAQFLNPKDERSAHVIIGENGERRVFANPENVTFHGGQSAWNVDGEIRSNVNDFMLGVEFQGNTNNRPLTDAQINSFIEYIKPIIQKYNIPLEMIVTHQDVADMYDEYVNKKKRTSSRKVDINKEQYKRIIDALLKGVYYKK